MNLDNINKINSKEWALFNGNSKGAQHRAKLIAKHGGRWETRGRHWFWNSMVVKTIQFNNKKINRKIYRFKDKEGIHYITDNFEPRNLPPMPIVAVHAKEQSDAINLIKTFYLKFPQYRWFTFRDMRGLSEKEFANSLKECFLNPVVGLSCIEPAGLVHV